MAAIKNIMLVITKSNFGGAQKYVHDLAIELKKNNYNVKVAVGGDGILIDKLVKENIDVIRIPNLNRDISIFSDIKTFIFLYKLFKKHKPDVVHLNSSKIGGIGVCASRLAGVRRIIFTAHGWAFNENRSDISKKIIKILYWITIFLSHKTIVVSNAMRNQISNWPLINRKTKVIHNGINCPKFLKKEDSLNNLNIKGEDNKIIIGTIAELHKIKGHTYILEAAKKLPFVNFVFIGDGEEKENLIKIVKEQNIKNIIFKGFIDNASIYLKTFNYFLLPSLSEGLAICLLEAGLAEVPVIATNVGGIPEVIKNKYNGILIEPKDSNAIVSAVDFLIGNPVEANKYTENLKKDIQENFSFENMTSKTIALYLNNYTIN